MIIGSYTKLSRLEQFKPGDSIWACEFQVTSDKESMRFVCKPVHGMLAAGRSESAHNEVLARFGADCDRLSYFVPFKKDGVSPCWSRAVQVSARHYATTEEDCITLYNERVCRYISWLNSEIDWANKQKVQKAK